MKGNFSSRNAMYHSSNGDMDRPKRCVPEIRRCYCQYSEVCTIVLGTVSSTARLAPGLQGPESSYRYECALHDLPSRSSCRLNQ